MSKYGVNLTEGRVRSFIKEENIENRLPFRQAFGASHMQEIFNRYADPDSRERIFPPDRYHTGDGSSANERRSVA